MNSARAQNTRALVIRPRGERSISYHGGWTGAVVARSESCVGVTVTHACNWGSDPNASILQSEWKGSAYLVRGCSLVVAGERPHKEVAAGNEGTRDGDRKARGRGRGRGRESESWRFGTVGDSRRKKIGQPNRPTAESNGPADRTSPARAGW